MRIAWLALSAFLLITVAEYTTPHDAFADPDACSATGAVCRFIDGSACATTCPGFCWSESGGCILGFGFDAVCKCHEESTACEAACQGALANGTRSYASKVSALLTRCELGALKSGADGGQCVFDEGVQAAIAANKAKILKAVNRKCSNEDIQSCSGLASVEEMFNVLTSNVEACGFSQSRTVFDNSLPRCGDNMVNPPVEECDGADDGACPGACLPDCTCGPVCGDGVVDRPSESCDPPGRRCGCADEFGGICTAFCTCENFGCSANGVGCANSLCAAALCTPPDQACVEPDPSGDVCTCIR